MARHALPISIVTSALLIGSLGLSTAGGATTHAAQTQRTHLVTVLAGRQSALTTLQSGIVTSDLSAQHALVLYALMSSEHTNLANLSARLTQSGKGAVPKTLVTAINRDANVQPVLTQQVHLITESDEIHTSATDFSTTESQLAAALAARSNAGGIANARTKLSKAIKKTTNAQSVSSQVASTVLGATPVGYPANVAVFATSSNRLATVQAKLADVSTALGELATYVANHPAHSSTGATGTSGT